MSSRGNEIGGKYYKGFNVAFFFLIFFYSIDLTIRLFYFYLFFFFTNQWFSNSGGSRKMFLTMRIFFFLNKILRGASYTIQPIGFDYVNVKKFFLYEIFKLRINLIFNTITYASYN